MTGPELTQEMIDADMARAEKVACVPGDHRCYAFPDPLEEARQSCTPKGRCKIDWIVAEGGQMSYDAWLDVLTGGGALAAPDRLGVIPVNSFSGRAVRHMSGSRRIPGGVIVRSRTGPLSVTAPRPGV